MQSLSADQRAELSALMNNALEDMDLAREMQQLGDALRSRRPDLDWRGRAQMRGDEPLGVGEGTSALQDLADLDELESALRQDYPGARLDDIDEEAVQRALGRRAADELQELRRLERELEDQGYLTRQGERLDLTAKAVRRLGQTALRRVLADLRSPGDGSHDVHDAGRAGELTGASRPWQFGDEQPLDVVRTLTNAVRRGGRESVRKRRSAAGGRGLRGGRDRPAHVGSGLPAGGHVLLDGAARHLGPGEGDGAGAARLGERAVPAGRAADSSASRRTRVRSAPRTSPAWRPTTCRGPTCSTR